MSVGLFTDKRHQPSEDEVSEAIGGWLAAWQKLILFIRDEYPSEEDFKFMYGKNYGWARRFRIRGQFLTNLYPTAGGFTVQINLSPVAVGKALNMQLTENVREVILRARPYPEGRWLFIPIKSNDDIQDIHKLLRLRVESKAPRLARF